MTFVIDWDQVSTLSRDRVIPKVIDQYFRTNALMYRLRPKADTTNFGRSLVQPLSFQPEGGGGGWWAGTDTFDIRLRNPITAAQYFYKNFELPLVISQDEEDAVSGPQAVMSLVEAKMKIAKRSVMATLGGNQGIYNQGTNPKAMTGLDYILKGGAGTDPPTMTYGGISSSATLNTWWNHASDATAYATGAAGSYVQQTKFAVWDKMFMTQSLAAGKSASLILCNWGVWNDILALIHANTTWFRPQQNQAMHQAGFRTFQYAGRDIFLDEEVPRGTNGLTAKHERVYFIDEEALHLWIHPKRNFQMTDWLVPVDQAIRVAHIFVRLEMGMDERRSSGVHVDVDTTATSP